ncbi:hypothetical protein [uncultured Salipiger sp.]|uniref:hypothetical protein n=1 Tax=uncultured Salipiger sp. TaxID=499810 RepID=UPI0025991F63|nr:hypothetical protein [uncultured Salipiger sp.]
MRRVPSNDPQVTARVLARITLARVDGAAIMAPESPQVRDASTRLVERGVEGVQVISGQPGLRPLDFVGLDNHQVGRWRVGCSGERRRTILVLSETMNSLDSVERRLGFDTVLTAGFPQLTALPSVETFGDPVRTRMVIANSHANHPDIVGACMMDRRRGRRSTRSVTPPTRRGR